MFLFVVEIIGTAAFALSGAMEAIKKNLDLLGIIVLGVITAVGGGACRDILLGSTPPTMFVRPVYSFVAMIVSLLAFFIVRIKPTLLNNAKFEQYLNVVDAIGLGAFTVVGVNTGINAGFQEYSFFLVFLGVITGVGGGMLRDILAGEIPAILKKRVYAVASTAGALFFVWTFSFLGITTAMSCSAILIIVIRLLATIYKWNLPKAIKE